MKRPARKAIPDGVKIRACLYRLVALDRGFAVGHGPERSDAVIAAARGATKQVLNVLLAMLGFKPGDRIEWNHSPAIGIRRVNDDGIDYVPAQLDPRHLYPELYVDHRRTTSGAAPGEGKATVADSDQHKIAKATRLETARMVAPVTVIPVEGEIALPGGGRFIPQSSLKGRPTFPAGRKLQSRPFQKRRK